MAGFKIEQREEKANKKAVSGETAFLIYCYRAVLWLRTREEKNPKS